MGKSTVVQACRPGVHIPRPCEKEARVAVCEDGPSATGDERQGDPWSLEWSTPPPGSMRNPVSSRE